MRYILRCICQAVVGIVALVTIGTMIAFANYAATQGSGTTFASVVVSTAHYMAMVFCDPTAGSTQCAAVDLAGGVSIKGEGVAGTPTGGVVSIQGVGSGTAVPISGTITANAGTNLNTSTLSTSANQTNKSQFTQLTDGTNAATTYTSYGTAPSGNVPGVNAFVTNANPNGAASVASSSSVTLANQPPGAGTIATGQASVPTGATLIVAARTGVAGTGRVSATICNTSTGVVYLGPSSVTTANGQYLAGVAGACATFNTTAAIYGIASSGSETVSYSETF